MSKNINPKDNTVHFDDPILSEFRIALLQEIDAIKRSASSSAVPLVNGRRVAQLGKCHQYAFEIENALNLPGDTPGDLHVPGYRPIEVVIVSVIGMTVTLSIPENLGKFVPSARLESNLAFLMRKLINRIETKARISNPVGDRILGNFGDEKKYTASISNDGLNRQQYGAVESSLSRNITFIGGPPGTGKTLTIGNIGRELYQAKRSTLLVSHTNTAVDGAVSQIGKLLDSEQLEQGKIIRVGVPKDPILNPELLLSTHIERRSAQLTISKNDLEAELEKLTIKTKEKLKLLYICEWVNEAHKDILFMEKELSKLYHCCPR